MAEFSMHKNLVEGENISIEQNNDGNLIISSTGGATKALEAMLNWENIKASRTTGVEVWTGAMTGIQKVYGQCVDLGSMPNTNGKQVLHGIANIDKLTRVTGIAYSVDEAHYPLPYAFPDAIGSIQLYANRARLDVRSGRDRDPLTGVAFLEYTCTDR